MIELSIKADDDFEKSIFSFFKKFVVSDEMYNSNTLWTNEIKNFICDIVKKVEPAYRVASHSIENCDWGEWLYDITVYKYGNCLTDIYLVAEIEWGNFQAVQDDFEKLVQARSLYKLMIFEANTENEVANYIEKLCSIAEGFSYSIRGDRYLFAGWSREKDNNQFHCHHYLVKK